MTRSAITTALRAHGNICWARIFTSATFGTRGRITRNGNWKSHDADGGARLIRLRYCRFSTLVAASAIRRVFLPNGMVVRVTGISTSRTGVEHAQLRAKERGYSDRVGFIVADGMDNGLPAESFDRIWVLESSHLMPRKDALLTECARVVRPGGRVALCDVMLRRDLPFAEVLSRSGDFIHLNYAFGRAKMEPLATYRRFAETAGLHVIESTDISEQTFPTFSHWRLQVRDQPRTGSCLDRRRGSRTLSGFL